MGTGDVVIAYVVGGDRRGLYDRVQTVVVIGFVDGYSLIDHLTRGSDCGRSFQAALQCFSTVQDFVFALKRLGYFGVQI
jgi:hypothetical protein